MRKPLPLPSLVAVLLALGAQDTRAEHVLLDEIVVRAESEPLNQESLSVREVRESPARDVGEALKQVEGITIVRKGAIANDLVLRGFQRDNLSVLVDGVRLHGACPSRMDPPAFHYDFAEIEQVTVIKGPYDLSNPGGLGGTINAQTRQPAKGLHGEASVTYGDRNSLNSSLVASQATDRYDLLLGYAFKYSDIPLAGDGRLLTDIYPASSPNRYRPATINSKAYEINTGWLKFGLNPTANSRTDLSYTNQDADHVLYPYLKMDADYDRTHRLNWTYRLQKVSSLLQDLKLQVYWDKVNHLMDDRFRISSATASRLYSMQTDASTQVYGAKIQTALQLGPGTLTGGADYYNRTWDAVNRRAMYFNYRDLAMIPDVAIDNLGIWGAYELPLTGKTTLKGGMRGDLTWVDTGKASTTIPAGTGKEFSGISANLQLTYTPTKEISLFSGIGRGIRTPDQQELFLDLPGSPAWRGNPGLKATVNHQADLGIKYATDRFYVTTSLFYSDLQDYINLYQASNSLKSYQNIHASIWGAELGSQVALPSDLFLRATLSYAEGRNISDNRPLAEIPPLRGTLSLRYDNGSFYTELLETLTREQDRIDSGLNEQTTAGWATTDLKAGYTKGGFSVSSGINNLFNSMYYSHLAYLRDPFASGVGYKVPENGRTFYLSMAYRF